MGKVAAGIAAKNLAVKKDIEQTVIDDLLTLQGKTLEDKIKIVATNKGATIENIKQILRYYPDGS